MPKSIKVLNRVCSDKWYTGVAAENKESILESILDGAKDVDRMRHLLGALNNTILLDVRKTFTDKIGLDNS